MKHHKHIHKHDYVLQDSSIAENEKRTIFVIILTAVTMIVELVFGYLTSSMALLADAWHMASHVGALGISVIAYRLAKSKSMNEKFSFGTGKFIPLGGYTSAILLAVVAVGMAIESLERFFSPQIISFDTAILISFVGLFVNLLSAYLLWGKHDHHHDHSHDHGHSNDFEAHEHSKSHEHAHVHDHNHRSALIHVITDALTSVFAIIALFAGKYFQWNWADPLMGVVGGIVILKWAISLCKSTAWELLDGKSLMIQEEKIYNIFSTEEKMEITDLHIWRIAPDAHACELKICRSESKGPEYYRQKILAELDIAHIIIEETACSEIGAN
ncbi:MAG: CDF family Co(II)/Ni(II) efflux transporter DmeF [Bdellovibrionota bacterium]|nr:CDF family Co(II)/Ni(II) efflux transporter DmeF [Bdellovibrionota bacterium]